MQFQSLYVKYMHLEHLCREKEIEIPQVAQLDQDMIDAAEKVFVRLYTAELRSKKFDFGSSARSPDLICELLKRMP